uniref:Variable lymphocyte receptor A diversity region n=1 Tax=Stichopus japonicus TaxID=307972 RepID=A0A089FM46_STIJA|nr:variable lymphocyte receptor A diversity region [Apostichopus japonicus]
MLCWALVCCYVYACLFIACEVVAEECLETCTYTAYAKDADCTDRGLSVIPAACPQAHTLDVSSNSLVTLSAPSLQGYYQLRYLHLERNQLSHTSPGAFDAVKRKLQLVNISSNRLSIIEPDTFVNMTLKYLLLFNNEISEIKPGAFKGMKWLAKIYLQDNQLTSLEYSMFDDMPRLREIQLQNNLISSLDVTFIPAVVLLQKIFLQNNAISVVNDSVETEQSSLILINLADNRVRSLSCSLIHNLVSLNDFYLANNSLETLDGCRRDQIPVFKISDNPFNCDCELRPLIDWFRENPDDPSPLCSSPVSLRGTPLRDAQLDCAGQNDSSTTSTPTPSYWMAKHSTTDDRSNIVHSSSSVVHEISPDPLSDVPNFVPSSRTNDIFSNYRTDKLIHSFDRNLHQFVTNSSKDLSQIPTILASILIAIFILIIIILVLLVLCLKHYCSEVPHEEEGKKKRSYDRVPSVAPLGEIERAEDASAHSTSDHKYESIRGGNDTGKRRTPPPPPMRHFSVDSQGSHVQMIPGLQCGENHRHPSNGLCNPGMLTTHHRCSCECHEDRSDISGSWASTQGSYSDISYETENNFNEISEGRPPCQNHGLNCSATMPVNCGSGGKMFCYPLNTGYSSSGFTASFKHPSPPPLPPKYTENDHYIQHNRLQPFVLEKTA